MKAKVRPQPKEDELFKLAVDHWLRHIEDNYVETVLQGVLKQCHGDITKAIETLSTSGRMAQIGHGGFGDPGGIKWDAGGIASASDFIKVYWGSYDNLVMKISMREILEYLKNGKAVQATLF